MAPKKDGEQHGAPWTTPGTDPPEKRPGPFAQDPSAQDPSRTPPTKEQRERDDEKEEDDKMDAVMRDTPL
jgi:hypothetical protein